VLLRLVQTGTGALDLRRRAPLAEILAVGDPTETTAVVNALTAARLLVLADGVVELAHEALTRAWPRLREWITEDHERLRLHRDLTTAASTWLDLGRDPGALYRGVRLAAARGLAERTGWRASSTLLEREFLDASAAHEEAQRQAAWRHARRMRRLAQGLGALLVACVVIATVAVVQRRAAVEGQRVAQSRQLALHAQDLSLLLPDDAKRLAVSAYRTAPTAEARGALLSTAAYKTPRILHADHHGSVRAVAYSPDGSLLASAGSDRAVLLRNASGGAPPVSLARHTDTVRALAFHPGGRLLVSAGDDQRLVVWNVAARAPAAEVPLAHGPITSLAFSPNGRAMVSGSQDGTVVIWDTGRWAESARVPHGAGEVTDVAFGADGTVVAVAGRSGVTVIDRARGTSRTSHDHDKAAVSVALSADARILATGGDDSQIVLRDLTSDAAPAHLRRHIAPVRALKFAPDDAWLMSASDDGSIRWWSVPSGGWLTSIFSRGSAFYTADLSPDGRHLAAGSEDTLNVWSAAVPPFTGHAVPPNGVAFARDGNHFVTAGADRLVIVWDRDGTAGETWTAPAAIRAVLFHPDGSVVTADEAGAVIVWDPARRAPVRTMTGHQGAVTTLALTRTGDLMASGGADGTVRLWEPSGPGGGRVLQGAHTAPVTTVAFSPDGAMLASGGLDGRTVLWDVRSQRQVATLGAGGAGAKAAAFTPDGRRLVVGDSAATITVWDVRQQRPVRTLPAQRGTIRSLAVSADGRLLASAANDTVVTLWALDTGRHVATLTGHTGQVAAVAFGPAGSDMLASTGADPRIVLWNLDPDAVIVRICTAPGARCARDGS
jgi:WD40 repeat protein